MQIKQRPFGGSESGQTCSVDSLHHPFVAHTDSPVLVADWVRSALLSVAFGLAIGLREGGISAARHAVAAPAMVAAMVFLALPSLTIFLSLIDAPVRVGALFWISCKSAQTACTILGGFAPLMALISLSGETRWAGVVAGWSGLLLASVLAARVFWQHIDQSVVAAASNTRVSTKVIVGVFILFLAVLLFRVALSLFPALRGV